MRNIEKFSYLEKTVIYIYLVACSCFHLYTAAFGIFTTLLQRSIHLFFLLPLAFIFYPANKKSYKDKITLIDWLLAILAMGSELLIIIEQNRIIFRFEHLTPLLFREIFFGTIIILLVLEAARRAVSPILAGIAAFSIMYLILGHLNIFTIIKHPLIPYQRVIEGMYLLAYQGVHGVVVGVSATYVFLFILFGEFLIRTNVGNYIIDLASLLFGKSTGGAAKVAVTSSALFGSISGSGPANVFATGSFTIPLMKDLGYKGTFAAAVEAAASTGGQYMPPVMGAVAFIISETTGVSYLEVCKQAIIPALLYYISIFIMVHLESNKLNLQPIPKEKIKSNSYIFKESYLLLPLITIMILIIMRYTPFLAAFIAIILTFLISFLDRKTMMLPKRLFKTLAGAAKNAIMIAVACACVGIISGAVIYTGLGLKLSSIIISLAHNNTFIVLLFSMVICILLGMGVPCVPAYVVTSVITLPILTKLGIRGLGPHLFIFYYAVIASITPPVAISAYAASSIARSNPMKTSWRAAGLAFVGFVIPFSFIYNPALLMQGSFLEIIKGIVFSLALVVSWSSAIEGYFTRKLNSIERIGMFILGIIFIFFINYS